MYFLKTINIFDYYSYVIIISRNKKNHQKSSMISHDESKPIKSIAT